LGWKLFRKPARVVFRNWSVSEIVMFKIVIKVDILTGIEESMSDLGSSGQLF